MTKEGPLCFPYSAGEFQVLAVQGAPDIENVTNFCVFYKALVLQSLWNGNFFELADNGLSGCSPVVRENSRKWGRCWWCLECGSRALVGGWDLSKNCVDHSRCEVKRTLSPRSVHRCLNWISFLSPVQREQTLVQRFFRSADP